MTRMVMALNVFRFQMKFEFMHWSICAKTLVVPIKGTLSYARLSELEYKPAYYIVAPS